MRADHSFAVVGGFGHLDPASAVDAKATAETIGAELAKAGLALWFTFRTRRCLSRIELAPGFRTTG